MATYVNKEQDGWVPLHKTRIDDIIVQIQNAGGVGSHGINFCGEGKKNPSLVEVLGKRLYQELAFTA